MAGVIMLWNYDTEEDELISLQEFMQTDDHSRFLPAYEEIREEYRRMVEDNVPRWIAAIMVAMALVVALEEAEDQEEENEK